MRPVVQVILITLSFVLQCCAATTGVEPTDLGRIRVGATFDEVQKQLGTPLRVESAAGVKVATYPANLGSKPIINDGDLVYGTLSGIYLIMLPAIIDESNKIYEKQRGNISITYDNGNRVTGIYRETALSTLASAFNGDLQEQLKMIELSFEPGSRWYWVCRTAYNGSAFYQFKMGELYYEGAGKITSDRIQSLMWHNLSVGNGYTSFFRDHLARELSAKEIEHATLLTKLWKSEPGECAKFVKQLEGVSPP